MEIVECQDEERYRAVWPVMRQLRNALGEGEFLVRLDVARQEGYRLFAASTDGTVTGAIGWRIINDLAFGKSLYVDDLVVDEALRGGGVGAALLDFARSAARREGCTTLRLTSSFARKGAHAFYERKGMTRAGYVFSEAIVP